MKILYGVQATGNGHITRARALGKELKACGLEVDFLFSGRDKDKFFDMAEFGDWQCYQGLTFVHEAGKTKLIDTIKQNSLKTLFKDIRALDVSGYDLIITDFEPISAWAAKRAGKPCIGMGHQYAFNHAVPKTGDSLIPRMIMRNFAPASIDLGLHWHHFGYPILPPIAETHVTNKAIEPNKVVVYLGFEDPDEVVSLLEPFTNHLFTVYGPFAQYESMGHIQLKPLSRDGFQEDLATAAGVICNAGFELSSEAIQLGKKLLVKPLQGQMEQLSNAKALTELGLGMAMNSLDPQVLDTWLKHAKGSQVKYPNVAKAIAQWVNSGKWNTPSSKAELVDSLWKQVHAPEITHFGSTLPQPSLA